MAVTGKATRLSARVSYAAYDLLGTTAALVGAPLVLLLLCLPQGRGLGERLGRVSARVRRLHHPVWIHAASVGEVLAAEPLIRQIRHERPQLPILVSTTSLTGRATARARLNADATMLLPLDLNWIVERVMARIAPSLLILMETELWPALIRAAARQQVPTAVVSGRISPRAARRYRWVRWLMRPMLAQVSEFAMQSEDDAARIIDLGAPAARVRVIGSLKSARNGGAPVQHDERSVLIDATRPVFIAASTHPGEEQLAVDACAALWTRQPDVLLIIAPRRPERFDEVEQLLVRSGIAYARRTQLQAMVGSSTRVLLLDSIGELPNVLALARAVFVGGTIAPIGGHNVLEPALFGRPVAFGPHTANVSGAAAALLRAGAATQVHNAGELSVEWQGFLENPQAAAAMGTRGRQVLDSEREVVPRTFDLLRAYLPEVE